MDALEMAGDARNDFRKTLQDTVEHLSDAEHLGREDGWAERHPEALENIRLCIIQARALLDR